MKFLVKGLNYTKIETENTVQFWQLQKNRKPNECGVWIDGIKTREFDAMEVKTVSGRFHLVNIRKRSENHEPSC